MNKVEHFIQKSVWDLVDNPLEKSLYDLSDSLVNDSLQDLVRNLVYLSVWRSIEILGCDLVCDSVRRKYE